MNLMNFTAIAYVIESFNDISPLSPAFDICLNELRENTQLTQRDLDAVMYVAEVAREDALELAARYFKHKAKHLDNTHPEFYAVVEHAARMM